jgi:hypothetical protein
MVIAASRTNNSRVRPEELGYGYGYGYGYGSGGMWDVVCGRVVQLREGKVK